jgi:PKD repeat protein
MSVALGMALTAMVSCTVSKTEVPPLMGPSELSLSVGLTANPDVLRQDGASQSLIQIVTLGPDGEPVRGVGLRAEIVVGGVLADFGRLSTKSPVTDISGRAALLYTAPAFLGDPVDTFTVVTIVVTPTGTDYRNAVPRQVDIRLVPPGVVVPPNGNPVPRFTFSPASPAEFTTVTFDGSSSYDPDGGIVSYVWSFGDGASGTGRTAQHEYRLAGTYGVTLTVTDDRGASVTSDQQNITVTAGSRPTASFVFSPSSPGVNQQIVFNAASSTAGPGRTLVRHDWNFGSGSPQSGMVVTKSYDIPGTYNVTLTVIDDVGVSGTLTQAVTVAATAGQTPIAVFTFSPSNPVVGQAVNFNGSASTSPGSTIVSYVWDFGDGATGSGPTVSHPFAGPFTYVVRLTITDSSGRTGTTTQSITIRP